MTGGFCIFIQDSAYLCITLRHVRIEWLAADEWSQREHHRSPSIRVADSLLKGTQDVKQQRHTAIRDLLVSTTVLSQDELRKKLAKRGFTVTQATLSRDIHELRVMKGPNGYALPEAGTGDDDDMPGIRETLSSFGLEVKQAQNLLIVITTTGSAQPVAAALDYEDWPELMGTIAGDDTVLAICADAKQAALLKTRMEGLIG